ncbi:4-(cytidine 5'-diphospho)-2-C-methyl-D-erythritol kinase [Dietzia sp.]|uniref:4-(cytidine 5'-diphospho)-2-C-methyl-D-erythritol kinase n=1 Tax=Dietzia sp. TaxID=1871616 RepID=UPI002FD99249
MPEGRAGGAGRNAASAREPRWSRAPGGSRGSGVSRPQTGGERRRSALAPAKIDLHLGVGPLRPDGLHGLVAVSQSLSLYSRVTLTAEPDSAEDSLVASGPGTELIPQPGALVQRAIRRCFEVARRPPEPVRIEIDTDIPVASGLGGGAADAAAALLAADEVFGLGLGISELAGIAASLGTHVPLALHGGTVLGIGHGESITPMPFRGSALHWVVAMARDGLDAAETYAELDRRRQAGSAPVSVSFDAEGDAIDDGHIDLARALAGGDARAIAANVRNELGGAALALRPALRRALEDGREGGALAALVAGSGPTCLFLCADAEAAVDIATELATSGAAHAIRTASSPVGGARLIEE